MDLLPSRSSGRAPSARRALVRVRTAVIPAFALSLALAAPAFPQSHGSDDAAAPKAEPPASAPPEGPPASRPAPQHEGWYRDGFVFKKGKSQVQLTGYAQEDFRHFAWEASGDPLGKKRFKGRELRRTRIGARAKFGSVSFEVSSEVRKLATGSRLKSLNATYSFSKGLNIRVGFFKLPGSKEFNALTNHTDFVERTMIASRLVPERDWGLSAAGTLGRWEYVAGVFQGDGNTSPRRTGTTFASRAAVDVFPGVQLAGSFLQGRVSAGLGDPAKGASGQTPTGFTFWSRPYVNGMRRRTSASLSYTRESFRVLGEYLEEREGREGQGPGGSSLPDVRGHGLSLQASYILTGERKTPIVEPRRSLFKGGRGAVELLMRAESLGFDDTGPPTAFVARGTRAADIAPVAASAVEAGANYWASDFLKLQLTAMWERYTDPLTAPVPGRRGPYFSVISQVQLTVP